MRQLSTKGFKVVQDVKTGKITLERLPFYGRDASAKIRGRKSKKVRAVAPSFQGLFGKGRPS